jgi:hypothetical protein
MNNDNVPLELARALEWRSTVNTEESEVRAALELFQRATAEIPNPWVEKTPGDTRLDYVSDDAEEEQLAAGIAPIRKLFQPKQTDVGKTQPRYLAPPLIEQDDDQQYFRSPLEKLFHPHVTSIASAEAPRFQFTNRTATLARQIEPPDGGELTLDKRLGLSTRRMALTEFVKRRMATGATVEELATFAAQHDEETARLIREVAAEL